MSLKTTTEAAIYLGWSRELVVKLTERSPKSGEDRKLPTKDVEGATYFAEADLDGYRDYLASAWPKTGKASPTCLTTSRTMSRQSATTSVQSAV